MAEGSNGRRRFSDKWGKHELDVLAVLSSAFPQWLTSRQIAQRVKAYADSYGELADQAAKAAFAKQFQRDRAKLAAMGIAIESRQPDYSSKSEGQDLPPSARRRAPYSAEVPAGRHAGAGGRQLSSAIDVHVVRPTTSTATRLSHGTARAADADSRSRP